MTQTLESMAELFKVNINSVAENADEPEQMVYQIIVDMEDTFSNARKNAAESEDKELHLEVSRMEKELDEIRQKALELGIFSQVAEFA